MRPMPRPAYGPDHQELRARLLAALPLPCARCGEIIPRGIDSSLVHLDHLTPVSEGGRAGYGQLSHAHCNQSHGATLGMQQRNEKRIKAALTKSEMQKVGGPLFSTARQPGHLSGLAHTPAELSPDALMRVMAQPWCKALQDIPADAVMPRIMSGPHPGAIGSYGPELVAFCEKAHGIILRWWQKLVVCRLLEFDADGELVWADALISTARQVGKSVVLRCIALFRVQHPELFGDDVVMTVATSLKLAQELQRPAQAWAELQTGWKVWRGVAYTAIQEPAGRRWIVSAASSSHGYTVGLMGVDEAWGIHAALIEDHAEPTLLAASHPQLLMTSTAHQDATTLFIDARSAAVAELESPGSTLILEWSAPRECDENDPQVWRLASPAWTDQRQRLLAKRLESSRKRGNVLSFRTQYLNIWPGQDPSEVAPDRFIDPAMFAGSLGIGPMGLISPVLAIEDDFAGGAVIAMAERDEAGLVRVTGGSFPYRADAWDYLAKAVDYPGVINPVVLVGGSLSADPEIEDLSVSVSLRGGAETKRALSLYRAWLAAGRVVHDRGAPELARQMLEARTKASGTGVDLAHRASHVELVRAAVWAVSEAAQPTSGPVV
jgi:hypothetical protein